MSSWVGSFPSLPFATSVSSLFSWLFFFFRHSSHSIRILAFVILSPHEIGSKSSRFVQIRLMKSHTLIAVWAVIALLAFGGVDGAKYKKHANQINGIEHDLLVSQTTERHTYKHETRDEHNTQYEQTQAPYIASVIVFIHSHSSARSFVLSYPSALFFWSDSLSSFIISHSLSVVVIPPKPFALPVMHCRRARVSLRPVC